MKLEEKFRQNLLGHLSDEDTQVDVNIACKIAREFVVEFSLFLIEHYNSESENWSGNSLETGEVEDRDSYEVLKIEDVLKIYENEI